MLKRSIVFCTLAILSMGQAREAMASNVASVVVYVIFESNLPNGPERDTEMSYCSVDLLDPQGDHSNLFVAIHYLPSGRKERTRCITAMLDKDTPDDDKLTLKFASSLAKLEDEISLSTTAHDVIRKLPESKTTFHANISYKSSSTSRPQQMDEKYQLTYTLTDSF